MSAGSATGAGRTSDGIREARRRCEPVRVVGGGTWLDGGRPCSAVTHLDVSSFTGITRYEPGDFVLTARAGTTLREISEVAGKHGQWLTLDPLGNAASTIGATIATASYGTLATAYGTPRDHILGCEFVSGTGDVINAGGQVVKNVAGFDLVRLVTGAWGTLGVITEVTLRMRARPAVDCTLAVALPREPAAALWGWLRETEFAPLAAELVSASLARKIGLGDEPTALIRLGGNQTLVRAAKDAAASLGVTREHDAGIWSRLGSEMAAFPVCFRASTLPSRAEALWQNAEALAIECGGIVSCTVARGVARCALPVGLQPERLRSALFGVTLTGEQLPRELWPAFVRTHANIALEQRVQRAFDPDGILNPGILAS